MYKITGPNIIRGSWDPTIQRCKILSIKNGFKRTLAKTYFIMHCIHQNSTSLVCLLCSPFKSYLDPSSSQDRSISGVLFHVANGGFARVPHECVQPSLSRSSSPSRSIHSPEHDVIFHPSCSHQVPKVA